MRKIIGLFLLTATLITSGALAFSTYKTETIIGIGATLEKLAEGTVRVNALIPNAPAERSGLEVGDVIFAVKSLPDSQVVDVRNLPLAAIVDLIRGPEGVPVEISFVRENSGTLVLSIVREKFEVDDGE